MMVLREVLDRSRIVQSTFIQRQEQKMTPSSHLQVEVQLISDL